MIFKRTICILLIALLNQSCSLAQSASPANFEPIAYKKLIHPPYLQQGDTVAIVSPAGILKNKEEKIQQAVDLLKSWGLNTIIGKNTFNQNNQFSGTDEERTADFQKALDNPNIKAIWATRGGYGSVRILDKLDYTKFKTSPKWVIGYSDITALHNQIHNTGYESIHAIMSVSLTDSIENIKDNVSTFKDAIFGKSLSYTVESSEYNKSGYSL